MWESLQTKLGFLANFSIFFSKITVLWISRIFLKKIDKFICLKKNPLKIVKNQLSLSWTFSIKLFSKSFKIFQSSFQEHLLWKHLSVYFKHASSIFLLTLFSVSYFYDRFKVFLIQKRENLFSIVIKLKLFANVRV
jgi:hypothetical protein